MNKLLSILFIITVFEGCAPKQIKHGKVYYSKDGKMKYTFSNPCTFSGDTIFCDKDTTILSQPLTIPHK